MAQNRKPATAQTLIADYAPEQLLNPHFDAYLTLHGLIYLLLNPRTATIAPMQTGYFVRVLADNGKWENKDIAEMSETELARFFHSEDRQREDLANWCVALCQWIQSRAAQTCNERQKLIDTPQHVDGSFM